MHSVKWSHVAVAGRNSNANYSCNAQYVARMAIRKSKKLVLLLLQLMAIKKMKKPILLLLPLLNMKKVKKSILLFLE